MANQLDHIVIAHPNLDLAMQEFADLTGCAPAYGGPHLGGGTHNALASLGDSVYIELISPDPSQPHGSPLGERLASLAGSTLFAWAIRSNQLAKMAGEHCGFVTSKPFDMSRQQPDGDTLEWQLLNLAKHDLQGFAPFYIDWLECPHPATTNPVAGEFISLELVHPNTNLRAIAEETRGVTHKAGPANLVLVFEASAGPITLSSAAPGGFWG